MSLTLPAYLPPEQVTTYQFKPGLLVSPVPSPLLVTPIEPPSSNGKTPASKSGNGGSTPSGGAIRSQHTVEALETGVGGQSASSTAYCGGGTTASGTAAHEGEVASNRHPLGTRLRITSGPQAGREVVVEDRIGAYSTLDIYMSSCSAAQQYGRHEITYEVLGREMK